MNHQRSEPWPPGDDACGHHWHPLHAGWECCQCLLGLRLDEAPPASLADCADPYLHESVYAWLPPSAPTWPTGTGWPGAAQ